MIIEQAAFDFKAIAQDGAVLAAHIEIASKEETIVEASLREITLDGQPWQEGTLKVLPNKPAPLHPRETKEPLDALREVIGG